MRFCLQRPIVFELAVIASLLLGTSFESVVLSNALPPTRTPLVTVSDLNVGESQTVKLHDGSQVAIRLLDLREMRDDIRDAVRRATATVEVNGQTVSLVSSTYHLPTTVAGVQIDCPVTKGYLERSSKQNAWGLKKDARLRLWPAGSPLIQPGTFVYPVKQRWFASDTQMANVPCFVDGGEVPSNKNIYYHYGLDFGGVEGMVDVLAATNGLVVSAGLEKLPGYKDSPVRPRYDVIYVLDDRGWFYRYKEPGHYIASVKRSNKRGLQAITHLHIRVGTND